MTQTTLDYRGLYELPDELLEFRSAIRTLAEDGIRPRASEIDRAGAYPWDARQLSRQQDLLHTHDRCDRHHRGHVSAAPVRAPLPLGLLDQVEARRLGNTRPSLPRPPDRGSGGA